MEELKVNEKQAENEFDTWAEAMDLDIDEKHMDAEDVTQFRRQKRQIIKAITVGALTFNENSEAVYTPQNKNSKHKESLTFHERSGADLMAMDGKKKNQDVGKTFAVMASICEVHPKDIAGLKGVDNKITMALFSLLMD